MAKDPPALRKLIHIFPEGICRFKGSSGLFLQRMVCLHHFYVRTKIQHVKNGFTYRTHVTSLSMVVKKTLQYGPKNRELYFCKS